MSVNVVMDEEPTAAAKPAPPQEEDTSAVAAPGGVVKDDVSQLAPRLTGTGGRPRAVQFPWKLHTILEHCHENGLEDIMSWDKEGKSFQIHNKLRFESEVMPQFFDTNRFKSFQRSLNLWGFYIKNRGGYNSSISSSAATAATASIVSENHNKTTPTQEQGGECYHPHFVRGKTELCHKMQRIRKKTNKTRVPKVKKPTMTEVLDAYKKEETPTATSNFRLEDFQQRQGTLEKRAALLMAAKNNLTVQGGGLVPPSLAGSYVSPPLTSMSPMLASTTAAAQSQRHRMMLQSLASSPSLSSSVFPRASSLFTSEAALAANKRVMLEAAMDKAMQMTSVTNHLQEQQRLRAYSLSFPAARDDRHARMLLDLASAESPRLGSGGMPSAYSSCHGHLLPPLMAQQRTSHNSLAAALLSTSSSSAAAAFLDALNSSGGQQPQLPF